MPVSRLSDFRLLLLTFLALQTLSALSHRSTALWRSRCTLGLRAL